MTERQTFIHVLSKPSILFRVTGAGVYNNTQPGLIISISVRQAYNTKSRHKKTPTGLKRQKKKPQTQFLGGFVIYLLYIYLFPYLAYFPLQIKILKVNLSHHSQSEFYLSADTAKGNTYYTFSLLPWSLCSGVTAGRHLDPHTVLGSPSDDEIYVIWI